MPGDLLLARRIEMEVVMIACWIAANTTYLQVGFLYSAPSEVKKTNSFLLLKRIEKMNLIAISALRAVLGTGEIKA